LPGHILIKSSGGKYIFSDRAMAGFYANVGGIPKDKDFTPIPRTNGEQHNHARDGSRFNEKAK
jgi:hypothetical protein